MPKPEQLRELTKLADEFLSAMRSAAQALAVSGADASQFKEDKLVQRASDSASRFTAAASSSPDLAKAIAASPGLAALSLVSKDLANLAAKSPAIAELAVLSPNLARIAVKAPEMAELAKASPPLAAMIEAQLARNTQS